MARTQAPVRVRSKQPTNRLLRRLVAAGVVHVVPAGRMLFRQGEMPVAVFGILSGRVTLSLDCCGDSVLSFTAGPGDLLGLCANISGKPYEVTAETASQARIFYIRRPAFIQYLDRHPELCIEISQLLSKHLDALYGQIVRSRCTPRRARLATIALDTVER